MAASNDKATGAANLASEHNKDALDYLKQAAQERLYEAVAYLDTPTEEAVDQCITEAQNTIEVWRRQS